MIGSRQLTRERLGLVLLICLHIVVCCISLTCVAYLKPVYHLLFDPTRLLAPVVTVTNGIVVRWPSVAGRAYRLERATNLVAGFNTVVGSNIVATPPFNSQPDTNSLPSKARYYRIQVED